MRVLFLIGLLAGCADEPDPMAGLLEIYCSFNPVQRSTVVVTAIRSNDTAAANQPSDVPVILDGRLDAFFSGMEGPGWSVPGGISVAIFDPPMNGLSEMRWRSWRLTDTGRQALPAIVERGKNCPPQQGS